jgi:hypothetical protein
MKQFIKDWAWQILAVLFFVLYLGQGCTNNKLAKHDAEQKQVIDSLIKVVDNLANKTEIDSIFEKKLWKFLELEELSDKNKIPINELKYKNGSNIQNNKSVK